MTDLDLRITERARRYIETLLLAHPPGAVPALMFGKEEKYDRDPRDRDAHLLSESPWHFSLVVYPLERAEQLERDFARHDLPIIHRVGDLTLCIPQSTFVISLIAGRTLDVDGSIVRVL